MNINPILTYTELSYAAGLYEGEGCAGAYHGGAKRDDGTHILVGRIAISMMDPEPVQFMYLLFSGSCTVTTPYLRGQKLYRWCVSARHAEKVAKVLLPWTKSVRKAAQLQSILDYYVQHDNERSQKGWKPVPNQSDYKAQTWPI